MNCQDLEAIVLDRAAVPKEGWAHAEMCPQCAGLLAGHRRLDVALCKLAAETATAQAPERVERALLSALRAKQQLKKRGVPRWALAAAATVLVLLGAAASWIGRERPRPGGCHRVRRPDP